MTTDRELDARLAGAAGIVDDDLPALPEDFLDVLRASGAAGAPTGAASRRRRPGRRAMVRAGVAVVAVAAVWTTAVVVAPSEELTPTPGRETAAPSAGPPAGPTEVDGMTLVAAERVTFPFSLDPEPEGLTPSFGLGGGPNPFGESPVTWRVEYRAQDGAGFGFVTSDADPREEWEIEHELPQSGYDFADITETGTVDVGGRPADFVRGRWDQPSCTYAPASPLQADEPPEVCTSSFADLFWERSEGQWLWLSGTDEYADADHLVAVAESIVDRSQPVDLQLGLAPAGWTLSGYDEEHIAFVDSADPSRRLAAGLVYRWRGETVENAFEGMYSGRGQWVEVNGRPAKLVLVDQGDFDEWFLAGELEGGVVFMVQTPSTFTSGQVVEIAEQVTYTP